MALKRFGPGPRLAARLLLGSAAGLALAAAVLCVLAWCGVRYQGASGHWQLAVVGGAALVLGSALAWPPPARPLASAGLHGRQGLRPRVPTAAFVAGAFLCLLLLWLGADRPPEPPPERPPAVVIRTDPLFVPPGGERPAVLIDWPADPESVALGPGWQPAGGPPAATSSTARLFRADDGPADLRWLRIGNHRWPLTRPPTALPLVASGVPDAARLTGRLGPVGPARAGEPAMNLGRLVGANPPAPAFPAFDLRDFGGAGYKVLGRGQDGGRLVLYHWAALPSTAPGPIAQPPQTPDAFVLLGRSAEEQGHLRPLSPVLSSAYSDGEADWYLSPGGAAGLDTLGESGLLQGPEALDRLIRVWRSRRHAGPGAAVLSAAPPARRPSDAAGLATDRFAPAPPASDAEERRTGQEFPAGNAAAGAGCVCLLLTAWGWWLRRGD